MSECLHHCELGSKGFNIVSASICTRKMAEIRPGHSILQPGKITTPYISNSVSIRWSKVKQEKVTRTTAGACRLGNETILSMSGLYVQQPLCSGTLPAFSPVEDYNLEPFQVPWRSNSSLSANAWVLPCAHRAASALQMMRLSQLLTDWWAGDTAEVLLLNRSSMTPPLHGFHRLCIRVVIPNTKVHTSGQWLTGQLHCASLTNLKHRISELCPKHT
jgi:hypothetical protein